MRRAACRAATRHRKTPPHSLRTHHKPTKLSTLSSLRSENAALQKELAHHLARCEDIVDDELHIAYRITERDPAAAADLRETLIAEHYAEEWANHTELADDIHVDDHLSLLLDQLRNPSLPPAEHVPPTTTARAAAAAATAAATTTAAAHLHKHPRARAPPPLPLVAPLAPLEQLKQSLEYPLVSPQAREEAHLTEGRLGGLPRDVLGEPVTPHVFAARAKLDRGAELGEAPAHFSEREKRQWRQERFELEQIDRAVDEHKSTFYEVFGTEPPADGRVSDAERVSRVVPAVATRFAWHETLATRLEGLLRRAGGDEWELPPLPPNERMLGAQLLYDLPGSPRDIALAVWRKRSRTDDDGVGGFELPARLVGLDERASVGQCRHRLLELDGSLAGTFAKALEGAIERKVQTLAALTYGTVASACFRHGGEVTCTRIFRELGTAICTEYWREDQLLELYEIAASAGYAAPTPAQARAVRLQSERSLGIGGARRAAEASGGSSGDDAGAAPSRRPRPPWGLAAAGDVRDTTHLKLAAHLVDMLVADARFDPAHGMNRVRHGGARRSTPCSTRPAFVVGEGDGQSTRLFMDPQLLSELVYRTSLPEMCRRFAVYSGEFPMLTPPLAWAKEDGRLPRGGFLHTPTAFVRSHSPRVTERLSMASADQLAPVFDGLNACAATAWSVNAYILDVAERLWDVRPDGAGLIPPRDATPPPTPPPLSQASEAEARRQLRAVEKRNAEMVSLRATLAYKLGTARDLRDEERFYFAMNLDFRGRAYPVSPHLSPTNDDLARAMLVFADPKPLGERGRFWLRVHLANLYGNDKAPLEERAAWAEREEASGILGAVAAAPLDEAHLPYWLAADKPFQFLAVCRELAEVAAAADPAAYESRMPVHQDGSCNGLQHFSALGRDALGGLHVNLIPSDDGLKQDVYTGVLERVRISLAAEAAELAERTASLERHRRRRLGGAKDEEGADGVPGPDEEEWSAEERKLASDVTHAEYAQLLEGLVSRKVVKQPVMTSVYGVTLIGARDQVKRRLLELPAFQGDDVDELELKNVSMYLARVTLRSIGEVVRGAFDSMAWLRESARTIAREGHAVEWVSPLGLPVVQPYMKSDVRRVTTKLGTFRLVDGFGGDSDEVDKFRQVNGVAPNFVHTLDGTHMLMTASECRRRGIVFAAVHDSYWSHAADMDEMGDVLRKQFVDLHSANLFEDLREHWYVKYGIRVEPPPERGELDLAKVRESQFFFS